MFGGNVQTATKAYWINTALVLKPNSNEIVAEEGFEQSRWTISMKVEGHNLKHFGAQDLTLDKAFAGVVGHSLDSFPTLVGVW